MSIPHLYPKNRPITPKKAQNGLPKKQKNLKFRKPKKDYKTQVYMNKLQNSSSPIGSKKSEKK